MAIGPSTVGTGYNTVATQIEQQRKVFKNPRGLGYYYALFRETGGSGDYGFYKSQDGSSWSDTGISLPVSGSDLPPDLWITEDNPNTRLLVYVIQRAGVAYVCLHCYEIDDSLTNPSSLFTNNEVAERTDDAVRNPAITLDSSGYVWVSWCDEFTNKGKQRNKLRATRSTTTYPVTAPSWETIVDVYGEKDSTDYPSGIRCNSGPFLRSELVPLTVEADVGVVFSYADMDGPSYLLKACTLNYDAGIDEGTMVAVDDTVHADLIHSSVAESGVVSDVFIGYKDSNGAGECRKWDLSVASSADFGSYSIETLDTLSLSIDKNSNPDKLYAFHVKTSFPNTIKYKTKPVTGGSWSSMVNIPDNSESLDYLSASYQDWDLDGDVQIIYTRQTNNTVRFWATGPTGVAAEWKQIEYFNEPPTGDQWNRLRYEAEPPVSGAWNRLKYKP